MGFSKCAKVKLILDANNLYFLCSSLKISISLINTITWPLTRASNYDLAHRSSKLTYCTKRGGVA